MLWEIVAYGLFPLFFTGGGIAVALLLHHVAEELMRK